MGIQARIEPQDALHADAVNLRELPESILPLHRIGEGLVPADDGRSGRPRSRRRRRNGRPRCRRRRGRNGRSRRRRRRRGRSGRSRRRGRRRGRNGRPRGRRRRGNRRDADDGVDLQVSRIHARIEVQNALYADAIKLREFPEGVPGTDYVLGRALRAGAGRGRRGGRNAERCADPQILRVNARIEGEDALHADAVCLRELPERITAFDGVLHGAWRTCFLIHI